MKIQKKAIILLFFLLGTVILSGCEIVFEESKNEEFVEAIVTKHVDGDTIYVKIGEGKDEKLRFIGLDAPEIEGEDKKGEFYGDESSAFTKEMLLGKTIYLEMDISETDRFGRLLRYIWLELPTEKSEEEIREKLFNAILIAEGYAKEKAFPPDVKYYYYLTKIQREAKEQKKGLWGKN